MSFLSLIKTDSLGGRKEALGIIFPAFIFSQFAIIAITRKIFVIDNLLIALIFSIIVSTLFMSMEPIILSMLFNFNNKIEEFANKAAEGFFEANKEVIKSEEWLKNASMSDYEKKAIFFKEIKSNSIRRVNNFRYFSHNISNRKFLTNISLIEGRILFSFYTGFTLLFFLIIELILIFYHLPVTDFEYYSYLIIPSFIIGIFASIYMLDQETKLYTENLKFEHIIPEYIPLNEIRDRLVYLNLYMYRFYPYLEDKRPEIINPEKLNSDEVLNFSNIFKSLLPNTLHLQNQLSDVYNEIGRYVIIKEEQEFIKDQVLKQIRIKSSAEIIENMILKRNYFNDIDFFFNLATLDGLPISSGPKKRLPVTFNIKQVSAFTSSFISVSCGFFDVIESILVNNNVLIILIKNVIFSIFFKTKIINFQADEFTHLDDLKKVYLANLGEVINYLTVYSDRLV